MATTGLSSKGQVTLPKAVRDRHGWQPGVELEAEDRGGAVVLRPAKPFAQTTLDEVRSCLKYDGPPFTIEDMDKTSEVARVRAAAAVIALDTATMLSMSLPRIDDQPICAIRKAGRSTLIV